MIAESRSGHGRLPRRAVLRGALAAAAVVATRPGLQARQLQTHLPPGSTPKPRGPAVFLDYDKEELDASYNQAPWSPNAAEIRRRTARQNTAALARVGPPRRLAYGPTGVEQLDLYTTKQPNAPVNVFIHGGAWRGGRAADRAYMAEVFVDRGAHFVAVDFNNVDETKGNLMTMAEQVRRSIAWVFTNAASFGGDQRRLYLSSHSSGAHLAAVALTTDWQHDFGLPVNPIRGALCASGMYELHPVSLSARNTYVDFTPEVLQALSPLRHINTLVAPVIVAYGTRETPEFQRQSREFAAAVKSAGKAVTLLVGEGYNHFELEETLGNPYGLLGRAALQQMGMS